MSSESNPAQDTSAHGRHKKRNWFKAKYQLEGSQVVKSTSSCKFFETTGKCRNGDICRFSHDITKGARKRIEQPCKFLYCPPFRCSKEDDCHFSHDLSRFPCPHRNVRKGGSCPPFCKFDHRPLLGEPQRMRFARIFHSLLQSLGDTIDPAWKFYLNEFTDHEVLQRQVRQSDDNLFNVSVSSLGPAPWIHS